MSGQLVDEWVGAHEKFNMETDQDDLFPPGFWGGKHLPSLPGANATPGQVLFNADGAQRMKVGDNGAVWYMQGPKGDEWISRVHVSEFGMTGYWTRVGKEPRELRRDLATGGWSCFFTDHRESWWCKTRCVHPSGREVHYEGVMGRQRPTMIITAKGNYQYWHVHGNHVRKTRTFMPSSDGSGVDAMLCYEYRSVDGESLEKAHLVRVELSDGRVRHYAGPPGCERRTKTVFKCGTTQYYVGARGLERVERQDNANGDVFHYVGARGCERLWRIDNLDGLINLFQGPGCRERLHATINMHERDDRKGTCTLHIYRGERGHELRKRKLKSTSGAFEVLQGGETGRDNEKCLRMLRGDGVLMTRQTVNDPWLEHDESATAVPAVKRQRVKEKATALWAELEALAEGDSIKEQALVAMGAHFKELTDAVDKCVA
jgi:hypothetical protein